MSNITQLITDHLDIWTAADTEKKSGRGRASGNANSVYGIKKLRELILELAVRGKLVPQDPNDEPAADLLKRILAEKAKLVAEGKIKKDKPLSTVTTEERPHELPDGWVCTRLADIVNILNGRAYKKEELLDSGTPVLRVGNLFTSDHWYYSDLELEEEKYCNQGDLLFAWSASFGPFLWEGERSIFHYHIWKLDFYGRDLMYKRYLYTFLLEQTQKIKSAGHGVMMIHMTKEKMEKLVTCLPPLEEQHRIVAKVDELMSLCDQLEAQHNNAADAHEQLVSHLLSTLTQSQDAADFNANCQRIATHFDTLFTTESSIDALKQTLLQLAVMGKLVPQDPNDEPSSELLKRISNGKLDSVKKTKARKAEVQISFAKNPMLPPSWEEIEVQDFAEVRLGSTPSRAKSEYWGGDIPWVSSGEVANHIIMDTCEKISQLGFENSSVAMIPEGSLLIAIIGQGKTRGQSALLGINACTNQNVAALIFNKQYVIPEFAWIWAKSKYESHRGDGRGGAQPALNGNIVKGFKFSLPPIKEQHRIVAKIDELMTLCEQLKSRMTDARQSQQKLADALAEQALIA